MLHEFYQKNKKSKVLYLKLKISKGEITGEAKKIS
nr:MAG TPA: hypothetical protein [Caudoviricetes sp.]DAU68198.1 MAG TPA: hypothetical protein [Caudoviricetes sp.]